MRKSFLHSLKILERYTPRYDLQEQTTGIVTAGDSNVFDGIRILYSSIKNKINFLCYDIGFTKSQLDWAQKNNMRIKQYPVDSWFKQIDKWQTFLKPQFVDDSPFEYTIWIDSDCIVVGDLAKSPFISNKETFFVQHWIHQPMLRKNNDRLYERYPVKQKDVPYVNAGVFGINKNKDQPLITDWKTLIRDCLWSDDGLIGCLANWDEGALNWAIQKNEGRDYVKDAYDHNCFSNFTWNHDDKLFNTYHQKILLVDGTLTFPNLFFRKILSAKDPLILHFSTCMDNKRKYWGLWEEDVN